jgi:hypothetical protein
MVVAINLGAWLSQQHSGDKPHLAVLKSDDQSRGELYSCDIWRKLKPVLVEGLGLIPDAEGVGLVTQISISCARFCLLLSWFFLIIAFSLEV